MISTAIRPQRDVIGMMGQRCKSYEFDYLGAKFYVQETDTGYAIVEETWSGWTPVRGQRHRFILAEFERTRRQHRI